MCQHNETKLPLFLINDNKTLFIEIHFYHNLYKNKMIQISVHPLPKEYCTEVYFVTAGMLNDFYYYMVD